MPTKIIRKADKTKQGCASANADKTGESGASLGYKVDTALKKIIRSLARQSFQIY